MRRATHILPIVLLIVFSIIIYANTLKNGFVFDDFITIVNNKALIKDPSKFSMLIKQKEYFDYSGEITYRPIATFYYMLDYALYGLKPWGFHLTNALLHAINVVLLYVFLALLRAGRDLSANNAKVIIKKQESLDILYQPFLISLLFAAHPVLTEAVNAVSFREDLLSFLFYMATLNIYLFLRSESNRCQPPLVFLLYTGSCLLYLFALLSKEMAASLPLIVYCYEWLYCYRKADKFALSLSWYNSGYVSVTLAYLYLRFYYFYNPVEANLQFPILAERLLTIPWQILNYLKLTIFPVVLAADYKIGTVHSLYSIDFFLPFAIVFSLIVWVLITRHRELAFGIFFYLMALIPVYNIVPIAHPFAERYLYLPMVGFIIAADSIINKILRIRRAYIILFLLIVISVFSFNVVKRNSVWMDGHSLWSDTVIKMPDRSSAHHNLGLVYYREGRLKEAVQELNKAIGLNPDFAEQYYALAQVYEKQGLLSDAENAYKMAIGLKSDDERYRTSIAVLYFRQRRFDKSIQELETAYRLNPNEPRIYNNLELAYEALKASQRKY